MGVGGDTTFRLLQGPGANFSCPLRRAKATAWERKGLGDREASETHTFLQRDGSMRGPLLRAIWQVFCSTFLLGTLSLVISDAFRFTVPKLLRWVQALGALGPFMGVFPGLGVGSSARLPLPTPLLLRALGAGRKDTEEGQKHTRKRLTSGREEANSHPTVSVSFRCVTNSPKERGLTPRIYLR